MLLNSAYIDGDVRAQAFLSGQPTRKELEQRANLLAGSSTSQSVCRILERNLKVFAKADSTLEQSLQDLSGGAVVVCAGQQPGLFGGPLLSLYKAATAIKLASVLKANGINAVPLFWNASEDHDFAEANKTCFPALPDSQEPVLFKLQSRPLPHTLSEQRLTSADMDALRAIAKKAQISESFLPTPQEDMGSWNTRLMLEQTTGSGLLVCEPHWFAPELMSFRKRIINTREDLVRRLSTQTQALIDQGFTAPVHFNSAHETMLFVALPEGRKKLIADQVGFHAGSRTWTKDELHRFLVESPGSFSSSVLSRPIAQQYLFPVVSQVVGPTEIGYLAQIMPLFKRLDTEPPLFWPRAKFIAIGKKARGLADQLQVSDAALAKGEYEIEIPIDSTAESLVTKIEESLLQSLDRLDQIEAEMLRNKLIAFRRLVMNEWRRTRKEIKRLEKDRRKPITRALHELKQLLQPRGIPQERLVGVVGLDCGHTHRLLDQILEILDPMEQEVKVIELVGNENND